MPIESNIEYRPFLKAQREKIKELWNLYKKEVGFEGDFLREKMASGVSLSEALEQTKAHFSSPDVVKNKEAWQSIRDEMSSK